MLYLFFIILIDSFIFILSLYASFVVYRFSFLIPLGFISAYSGILLFLWLYYLIILNFSSLYNFRLRKLFLPIRILLMSLIYSSSLLLFSFMYPQYQFAQFFLILNFGFNTILLFAGRYLLYKYKKN
ncbi:hypothetical protein HN362_00255 [bacterium]|jgi:hypothetical protein|nr:hypothetical protein [bacterium]